MREATLYVFDSGRAHLLLLHVPYASRQLLAAGDKRMWAHYLRGVQKILAR
jgi:hypothetical protein